MKEYIKKNFIETVRDFTAFGDPLILIILSALILGLDKNLIYILIGLIFIELVSRGIRIFYYKDRPRKETHNNFLEKLDASSFPSIHSARSSFVFLVLYSLTNYPANLLFILLFLIVGFTRIILKKHYLIDIIFGFIIGGITYLIWLSII